MSQIRIAKAGDLGAFPGSTFVVDDTPPISQCQETQIVATGCQALMDTAIIHKALVGVGIDLTGKKAVVVGTTGDDGTYNVLSNTDGTVTIDHTFTDNELFFTTTIKDAAGAYLTRNQSSFTRFIQNQGNAYTTKGGQLFTDLTDPPMDDACSDTWSPD